MNPAIGTFGSAPALRPLAFAQQQRDETAERLATGLRINRGSDDPAGLISSEALRAMLAELEAESRAFERATRAADVADASLGAVGDLLIEAEALAVANASTGGLSEAERQANQLELNAILQSVDRLAQGASFADRPLLRGGASLSAGDVAVELPSAAVTDLGEVTGGDGETYRLADVASGGPLETAGAGDAAGQPSALDVIRQARDEILRARSDVGSFIAEGIAPLQRSSAVAIENTASAESVIRDADYAKQTAELIRLNALENASLTALTVGPFDPTRLLALLG
ncbi:MAG: flagellin [Planctomycetota bacterium]